MSSEAKDFPFLAYLDELMEQLHKNVPKALRDFDGEAVHDARVATRRLKAAMELLAPVLSDHHRHPFEKVLKKLRKRLGPLRDLDVMIERLSEMSSNAAARWLCDELIRLREKEREKAGKKAVPADVLAKLSSWWGVRDEIVEARDAIDSLVSESLHLQFDAFAEQASQLNRESPAEPRDPHELRIAGKILRYTLEMAKEQGHKLPASVLRAFKKMQEALGNWHDDVVLIQCMMQTSLDRQLSYHQLDLQEGLLKLSRTFLGRGNRELARFSKLWQKQGEEVAQTIRGKFPLTRAVVSEPQTDHGPADSGATPAPSAGVPPDVASTA
ncbi:MAG TPA: CHAD domain-containing protein [Tepidisphaeraceae bacterium]|nr:CHAD domain-containing protein [Tepidisphaeraceae bacterium]